MIVSPLVEPSAELLPICRMLPVATVTVPVELIGPAQIQRARAIIVGHRAGAADGVGNGQTAVVPAEHQRAVVRYRAAAQIHRPRHCCRLATCRYRWFTPPLIVTPPALSSTSVCEPSLSK